MSSNLYSIETGLGGLPKVAVTAPDGGRVEVYLHGATVTSWMPPGDTEQLYVSKTSFFEADKPIRGGVPVCFPQFGARGGLSMMHGFVRQMSWMFAGAEAQDNGGATARLVKMANEETRALWPFDFSLCLDVTLGGRQLELALSVTNPGAQPFLFGGALHTYFAVGEIDHVTVEGLQGYAYTDHITGETPRTQVEPAIPFDGLVNRIYASAPEQTEIVEPTRRVEVVKEGFPDVVVWNAGAEKGAAIVDLEPEGYRKYVCVEAALTKQVSLGRGETWRGAQRIKV